MFAYLMQLALLFGGIILVGVLLTWLHDLVEARLERVWTKGPQHSSHAPQRRAQPAAPSQPSPLTPILVVPYQTSAPAPSACVQVRPQRRAA